MAEVMSVLFFHTMRYKITEPRSPHSDRFILSKGHAAPILYAGEGPRQLGFAWEGRGFETSVIVGVGIEECGFDFNMESLRVFFLV